LAVLVSPSARSGLSASSIEIDAAQRLEQTA